ncbi:MAG: hypothetical protein ACFNVI_03335 [Lachnoanaerobaculum gingivalis]
MKTINVELTEEQIKQLLLHLSVLRDTNESKIKISKKVLEKEKDIDFEEILIATMGTVLLNEANKEISSLIDFFEKKKEFK